MTRRGMWMAWWVIAGVCLAPALAPSWLLQAGGTVVAQEALPAVSPGATVMGRIAPGESQSWRLEARAGQSVRIDADSTDFDTVLTVRFPDGRTMENDDRDPGRDLNSTLRMKLPVSGTYVVTVRAFGRAEQGVYRLAVASMGEGEPVDAVPGAPAPGGIGTRAPQAPPVAGPGEARLQGAGERTGRLGPGDDRLDSGEFVQWFEVSGPAGQPVTFTLRSTEFDTYLMLRGPGDFRIDNDDGPGMGTDSRIETVLPTTGVYRVGVTSYRPGEVGRYRLEITEGTTLTNARRPTVYAVLAGMTEYPNPASNLPWCAEDAIRLHEALAATGRLAPVSVLLTDRQVTRANLRDAVTRVAAAAGPDDVFLFFYSGHGNQVPALADDELDGLDEVLSVWDGDVRDREVAEWFDHSRARLSILALDACHAGGFARDVISAPGRIGIFSSEEDVTSLVAQRFEAGGYLSHFLRQAVEGAADTDPADGVLTVGELTQFLRRQWAEHMMETRADTGDGRRSYQNLVIVRGAVHVDEIVL